MEKDKTMKQKVFSVDFYNNEPARLADRDWVATHMVFQARDTSKDGEPTAAIAYVNREVYNTFARDEIEVSRIDIEDGYAPYEKEITKALNDTIETEVGRLRAAAHCELDLISAKLAYAKTKEEQKMAKDLLKKKVVEAHKAGYFPIRQIARMSGVTRNTVYNWVK